MVGEKKFNRNFSIESGILAFGTAESYDSVMATIANEDFKRLDEWEKSLGFISHRRASLPKSAKSSEKYFSTVLSRDRVVKIEKWYFKVDKEKEKVHVLLPNEENLLGRFISDPSSLSIDKVLVFSTSDDVLEILKTNHVTRKEGRVEGLFCSDRHAKDKAIQYHQYVNLSNNQGLALLNVFYEYESYGLNCTLEASISSAYWPTNSTSLEPKPLDMQKSLEMEWSYKQRCGKSAQNIIASKSGSSPTISHVIFSSSKHLKNYSLGAFGVFKQFIDPSQANMPNLNGAYKLMKYDEYGDLYLIKD